MSSIRSQVGASANGKSLSIYEVTTSSENEEGDITKAKEEFALDGVVQVATAEEDEVKAGLLQTGDLILYIPDSEANTSKLVNGNQVKYEGAFYTIKNVIDNEGHFEVHASNI